MKVLRKIIQIDEERCDGCGQCITGCAEGALKLVDGKARVVSDKYCDGLGACIGECPTGALTIIEREADEFDVAAVEALLGKTHAKASPPAGGCPSAGLQMFSAPCACEKANLPASLEAGDESFLSHWPIQIRLVPSNAPFLHGADLLVVADCVPLAYPSIHKDFMKGRAVLMGCPKFDDAQSYIDKFAEISTRAGLKSITVLSMEVPCCSGLPMIVKKGLEISGAAIPLTEVVISIKGKVLEVKEG
ncbi:MAG: 4Fe-4S dicluster domain-containing protein [Pseudomonadota bacterium]